VSLGWIRLANPVAIFALSLGLAMGAAFLSYRYFESRFLALKRRFSRLRPDPAASAPDAIPSSKPGVAVHP